MSRLIDADALMADCQLAQKQAERHGREFANAFYSGGGDVSTEWWCVEDMIENAPTIEPVRKTGRWIYYPKASGSVTSTAVHFYPVCSECGCEHPIANYCSNCGARMEEGEADG